MLVLNYKQVGGHKFLAFTIARNSSNAFLKDIKVLESKKYIRSSINLHKFCARSSFSWKPFVSFRLQQVGGHKFLALTIAGNPSLCIFKGHTGIRI